MVNLLTDAAPLRGGVLSGEQIRSAIAAEPPLIRGYTDLASQVQPNGFDLTLADLHRFSGPGQIGRSNTDRVSPETIPLESNAEGWWVLESGVYHIVYNEIVALPTWLMAFGRPRSSLNRNAVTIHTAVWDAGYQGRSTSLMHVFNPGGFRVQRGARVMQLVFVALAERAAEGYQGVYQGENI